jgi:ATP-dependent exoDNAse (exonuclease V) beta subunit
VWWDPACLDLDPEEELGVRQQTILRADESGEVAREGFERYERWSERRRDVRGKGSAPTRVVRKVTAVAKAEAERIATDRHAAEEIGAAQVAADESQMPLVELIELERPDAPRPGGERFGSLVHATLAVVSLDADEAAVRTAVDAQARMLAATAEEVEAAVERVVRALEHPILREAALAATRGDARREAPVLYRSGTGEWLEGVIDLAFRESPDAWTVVDFKTDRDLSIGRESYERQVANYAVGVAAATRAEVRGVILAL